MGGAPKKVFVRWMHVVPFRAWIRGGIQCSHIVIDRLLVPEPLQCVYAYSPTKKMSASFVVNALPQLIFHDC